MLPVTVAVVSCAIAGTAFGTVQLAFAPAQTATADLAISCLPTLEDLVCKGRFPNSSRCRFQELMTGSQSFSFRAPTNAMSEVRKHLIKREGQLSYVPPKIADLIV